MRRPTLCLNAMTGALIAAAGCGPQGGNNTQVQLTVNNLTPAAGTITITPAGGSYASGTTVTLTAEANARYSFLGYSGDASGSDPSLQVTLNDDTTITAEFGGNLFIANASAFDLGSIDELLEFDSGSGAVLGPLVEFTNREVETGPVLRPALAVDGNGDLYVAVSGAHDNPASAVTKFDGATGARIGDVVSEDTSDLISPNDITVSGNRLLIARADDIVEFNIETGQQVGVLVPAGSGGLDLPVALTVTPDGRLLVINLVIDGTSSTTGVLEYAADTGAFIREFIPPDGDGLELGLFFLSDIPFGPDGNIYLPKQDSSTGVVSILEFNGTTGQELGVFVETVGTSLPAGLVFGTNGNLFVLVTATTGGTQSESSIDEYDGTSGAPIGTLASSGEAGWVGGALLVRQLP